MRAHHGVVFGELLEGELGVIVIVVAVIFWVFNLQPSNDLPSSSRAVPAVTGMTFEEASAKLADEDLSATQLTEASTTVEKGKVIRTDPPAGETVSPGLFVKVYVSTGKEQVKLPDVTNQAIADAQAALTAAGLSPGSNTK
ncbi:PASTA domain-containing protein, partial [Rhizobium johnstonii]|uniref:PASTA domain-containing protein n=1 Tax=Rhizobium johnstonii TaxID=3019933 RepID=UPI003F952324